MKKAVSGIMLTLLILTSTLTLAFNIQPAKGEPTIIIVPDDYPTIQEALNNANEGDTIFVKAGIYYEHVVINKSVSLIGENRETTIIDGGGPAYYPIIRYPITVKANNVVIEGFTIRNSEMDRDGIYVFLVNHTIIRNNKITANSWAGIFIQNSFNNTISGNDIINNGEGIVVVISSNTTISGNNITANKYAGIDLQDSSNNTLRNNYMSGNGYNFYVWGEELSHFIHDVDPSNTVGGKPIYYWVNQQNLMVPTNAGQVLLVNSINITVRNLDLKNNGQGILLAYTQDSLITGNNLTNNVYGIWLYYSSQNTISTNIIANNEVGISFEGYSSYNNISGNNIANNYDGIDLISSSNNMIYHNNFVNNPNQVYSDDVSANIWDDGYPSGGNYWSDYAGVDEKSGPNQDQLGSDGIGDTPYIIDENNQDRYPLMNPYAELPVHNINTGEDFLTIQSAIDDSDTQGGHIITVDPGIYYENIHVTKSLTIKSTSGDPTNTIIMAKNPDYAIFSIGILNYVNISGFTIKGATEWAGIALGFASNCIISNNIVSDNYVGILLSYAMFDSYIIGGSKNNTIASNEIRANEFGIVLEYDSYHNKIYYNNFIDNAQQTDVYPFDCANFWDNGYPSGGNYWSDYTDVDLYSGPCQNETGSDGIWDHPYVIDENNKDQYPLVNPWTPTPSEIERIYGIPVEFRFNNDLHKGNNHPEVRYLQIILNTDPDTRVATSGPGMPGNETTYFGDLTENAVKKFQKKYGLPETGYVDELTRGKLNEILNNKFTEEYKNSFNLLNATERKSAIWNDIKSFKSSYPDLSSFPNELILAVAAVETGEYAQWNNEHVANDWGRGIMQITSNEYVGAGGVDNESEDCIKCRDRVLKIYCSKYYSNTLKGIEANIKDGLYTLQNKSRYVKKDKIQLPEGYTKDEIIWISTVQRYNVKSDIPTDYVSAVGKELLKLANGYYGFFDGFDSELARSLGQKFQKAYSESIRLYSPGELRVYDSTGNITGSVNGEIREEIPNSIYDNETKTVIIFFPSQNYYEVAGTETGTYGIDIASVEDGNATIFTAIYIPTSVNAIHRYTIDWIILSQGGDGVTVDVDSDGDGIFEYTFTSDSELTHEEFVQQTTPTYTLTITSMVGGTTDPAHGTYAYTANSLVQVTAIPNADYTFDHWELDTINVGSANPYTVLMDNNHTLNAVFTYAPPPPPLSVSISPLSASILVGQSVTFTSTVSGGYTPYSYQWYLNGAPVSGATSNTWAFTPTTSGIYYIYLKVTDAKGNTAQSGTARITAQTVPVGGYSISIQLPATAKPVTMHIALLTILTAIFITIKRKTKRKH
jgi:parallel beta-helix repeat protein